MKEQLSISSALNKNDGSEVLEDCNYKYIHVHICVLDKFTKGASAFLHLVLYPCLCLLNLFFRVQGIFLPHKHSICLTEIIFRYLLHDLLNYSLAKVNYINSSSFDITPLSVSIIRLTENKTFPFTAKYKRNGTLIMKTLNK